MPEKLRRSVSPEFAAFQESPYARYYPYHSAAAMMPIPQFHPFPYLSSYPQAAMYAGAGVMHPGYYSDVM